ncbi:MAG: amidohydrolase family protein, partial [Bacillota bacterium]|nr:amidohydrolase family protein [Bacillota bacterium]
HADEIVSLGGAELAARTGALSADHLLMVSQEGVSELSKSQTVATLLPATAFCLNKPYAPARQLIDSGCAVALATDFNPGSCFTDSIPLILALAVIHMRMSLNEALTALTLNGAAALGIADRAGSLEPGKQADYVILKYPDYQFLIYHTCMNIVESVVKNGTLVYKSNG